MPEINEIISKQAIDNIVTTDKAINQLDGSTVKFNKTIDSLISSLQKGNISFSQVQDAQKKTQKNTKDLSEEQKKLDRIEKQIASNTDAVVKAKIQQSAASREQKQRVTELVQAERGELGTLQKLQNENKKLTAERKTLNLETQKGRARLKEINTQLDANNKKIKDNSDTLTKQKINIGNYSSALTGLGGTLGRAVTAVQTFGRSLLALLANPIVAIVAAIVAVFAGLVAVFKSTDDGGTKLEALFNSLSSILDVLKRRAVILIEALGALFSGEFQRAGELFKETITGIGDELRETTRAAWDYTMAQDAINDRNIAFISDTAKARNEIERYMALSKDQTLSDNQRIDALQNAIRLEEDLARKKVELLTAELDNELAFAAQKANINKESLRVFIGLNEEQQTAARANSKILADAWNVLGDDTIKTLEELYAKAIDADTEYFRRSQRSISQLSGLQRRLNAGRIKDEEILAKDLEKIKLEELQIYKDFDNEIETMSDEFLDFIEENLDSEVEAVRNATDEELEIRANARQKDIEGARQAAELKKQFDRDLLAAGAEAVNIGFDIYQSGLERELMALQTQKQHQLELNEGNADAIKRINEKFAAQEAAIRTKQAKSDKIQALFNAANATGVSIIASAQLGFPAAIPFIALAAALGAAQLAAIAARPIPQFYTGTESAPKGLISVAERGRELIETKTGELLMANQPTITNGLEGAKIYTNKETEAIINQAGYDSPDLMQSVINSNNRVARAIERQPILQFETSKRRITERKGRYSKQYLNRKLYGI